MVQSLDPIWIFNHDKRVSFISDKGLKKTIFLRFMTILYYLNDVEDGGETAFPVADNETFDQAVSVRMVLV